MTDKKCLECNDTGLLVRGKHPTVIGEPCYPVCQERALRTLTPGTKTIPTSKERNILDLAKNLQDELHIYCKGAAGSGDNFYARTFANLADRADELVKLLESAPETGEQRTDHAENLAKAVPREVLGL